jgi:hypothetical protein
MSNLYTCRSEKEDGVGEGTATLIKKEIKYSELFFPELKHMEPSAAADHTRFNM